MRHHLLALVVVTSVAGCELVAKFDRDKIPPPVPVRPGVEVPAIVTADDPDGGSADAVDDELTDDESPDGAVDDESPDGAVDDESLDGAADDESPDGAVRGVSQ